MDKDKLLLFIQGCRDEYLSKENLNREFSTKAIAISAFAMTAYGVVVSLLIQKTAQIDSCVWLVFVLSSIFLAAGIICTLRVVIPSDWSRPFDLAQLKVVVKECDPEVLMDKVGDNYHDAVEENNEKALSPKANLLKWLVGFTAAQFLSYAILFVYLFYPGMLS